MKSIDLSRIGGFLLAVIILASLFVGAHYIQTDREAVTLCQSSSEPDSIRHRYDGFTKRAVIISHLRYYQRKFYEARIKLRRSYTADESPTTYVRQIKELAIVLSYWEDQYIKLKQQTKKEHRNRIYRT